MANKKISLGILVIILGIMVVGHIGAQENSINGTWILNIDPNDTRPIMNSTYKFNNGNYEQKLGGIIDLKGNYTVGNGRIIMNNTHIHGSFAIEYGLESKWYTRDEWMVAILKLPEEYRIDILSVETAREMFRQEIFNYTLNRDILTFVVGNETITFTRF